VKIGKASVVTSSNRKGSVRMNLVVLCLLLVFPTSLWLLHRVLLFRNAIEKAHNWNLDYFSNIQSVHHVSVISSVVLSSITVVVLEEVGPTSKETKISEY
jgi:hypothetical protein